jgi:shikimate dehydrogenase
MAATCGVVDTVLRGTEEAVGFNTNSYAAQAALRILVGKEPPARVLVAGTGASAKSVLWALSRMWYRPTVGIIGRSRERAARVAAAFPGSVVVDDAVQFGPQLVVHATAVGERDDAEPLGFDLANTFAPGVRLLDLTNRMNVLQRSAISAGCVTMSGMFMQLATNLLRVSLLVGLANTITAIERLRL